MPFTTGYELPCQQTIRDWFNDAHVERQYFKTHLLTQNMDKKSTHDTMCQVLVCFCKKDLYTITAITNFVFALLLTFEGMVSNRGLDNGNTNISIHENDNDHWNFTS